MDSRLPWDITAACADGGNADGGNRAPPGRARTGRCLIVAMLLTAAMLDLTRCGLVLAAARHPAPTAGLATAGLAAAALTARTARGYQAGQRWAGWAALLIGITSTPQAAASGFSSPYMIPDTATAVVGILLAITILATAGRIGCWDTAPEIPASRTGEPRGDPERSLVCTAHDPRYAIPLSRLNRRSASPSAPPWRIGPDDSGVGDRQPGS